MPGSAEGVLYESEFKGLYQKKASMLIDTVTRKTTENSSSVVFPFHDRKGMTTETGRNYDSNIIGSNSLTITTKTLNLIAEDSKFTSSDIHDMFGQMNAADMRKALMEASVDIYNLKAEERIIAALTSVNTTPSDTDSTDARKLLDQGYALLKYNNVGSGDIYAAVTPAFMAVLKTDTQFTSADYVDVPKFTGNDYTSTFLNFNGVKVYEINNMLTGSGTSSERCFIYDKAAIGFGETEYKKFVFDENEENGYSFARVSGGMGALPLQGEGIIELKFDGSGYNTSVTAT